MSKYICYSLFNGSAAPFENRAYLRGMYFNLRMNNLIFPDWTTHLEIDRETYTRYQGLFDWLVANATLHLNINETTPPLCEGMAWRMKPIFYPDVSHILCRDTDSITTYREALTVQYWLESGKKCHALNDNRAHSGLMGGMIGFDCSWIKATMEANSWDDLIRGWDLSQRGSDQNLLNQRFLFRIKDDLLLQGGNALQFTIPDVYSELPLPGVPYRLWESNLIPRHIGSAGFNELEALRFFIRFDLYNWKYVDIEKAFPHIFYWQL